MMVSTNRKKGMWVAAHKIRSRYNRNIVFILNKLIDGAAWRFLDLCVGGTWSGAREKGVT